MGMERRIAEDMKTWCSWVELRMDTGWDMPCWWLAIDRGSLLGLFELSRKSGVVMESQIYKYLSNLDCSSYQETSSQVSTL